jgi:hypothetical protein
MPSQPDHAPGPGLSPEELDAELATDLPEREALSIVDPGVFSVMPAQVGHIGRTADAATSGDAVLVDDQSA